MSDDKRRRRFDQIDMLPPDMRDLVNDEGWTIVDNFMQCGVKKSAQIRHLIKMVRDGTSAYGNTAYNEAFTVERGRRVPRSKQS
jgi:hypothetical protein